jgi:hypothetical protein
MSDNAGSLAPGRSSRRFTARRNFPEKAILAEVEGKLRQLKAIQRELVASVQV